MVKTLIYIHDFCFYESECSDIYTAVGLPESYFKRFFDAGVQSVIIISRSSRYSAATIVRLGFSKIQSKKICLRNSCGRNYLSLLNPYFAINTYFVLKNADYLVVSLPSIIGVYSLILNLIIGKKYSVEVSGDADMFSSKKGGWLVTFFLKIFMRIFITKAQGASYVTNYLKNKFINERITLVASNVNIPNIIIKNPILKPLKEKHIVHIGFVGGLIKRKGIDTILYSLFELVSKGYYNIKLHLIGGHSDFNWEQVIISLKLSDYVILHGICSSEDVFNFYELFDIYLQPSITEGMPRATIEAMSRGIPVIATKLPGFEELLSESLLIKVGDHIELSKLILKLMEDEPFWNKCSYMNSKRAKEYLYDFLHFQRTSYYFKLFNC